MEFSTIIGLVLGIGAVLGGMVLKGAGFEVLINPAAFLIILGGTVATIFIAFPTKYLRKVPSLIAKTLIKPNLPSKARVVLKIMEFSYISRKSGILILDKYLGEIDDEFFKKGLTMVIDGAPPEIVEKTLTDEILSMEDRHRVCASIFSQAGTYAPTLGVLGAVVGLVASLGNLNNVDVLGYSIAAAFVATLLGIFTGYVICHPISNKLKVLSKEEVEIKELILEGVLAIQKGLSPSLLENTILARLSKQEIGNYENMKNKDNFNTYDNANTYENMKGREDDVKETEA